MSEDQDDEGTGDTTEAGSDSRAKRLGRFAKEHPGTTLIAAAGASAFLGGEFALGALLGVGAALLVTKKRGGDLRGQLRELIDSTKGFARRILERPHTDQESGATPPA